MSDVITDIQEGFIIVTINRPEAKNAITQAAAQGIRAAMEQLDNDNSLNAGILTGAGGAYQMLRRLNNCILSINCPGSRTVNCINAGELKNTVEQDYSHLLI